MKKYLKYFLITFASALLLVFIAISVALWFVFTPEKLTPVVRNQAAKFINCHTEIGRIELSFFSTFPKFGLKADRLVFINPVDGAPCDTLLKANEIVGIINISSLIRDNELIVSEFRLSDGRISAFIDSLGFTNFDIFPTDTLSIDDDTDTDMFFKIIDVSNINLKDIDVSYLDLSTNMKADVRRLTATISGSMEAENITAVVDAKPFDVSLELQPEDAEAIKTEIRNLSAKIDGSMSSGIINGKIEINPFDIAVSINGIKTEIENFSALINCATNLDDFSGEAQIKPFRMTLANGAEKYLQDAEIQLNLAGEANLSNQTFNLKNASMSLNGLKLDLSGTVENDTINNSLATNLSYKFNSWSIQSLLSLVPASMASLLEGIDASGQLSSEGVIDGIYSQSSFPMADIRLTLERGTLTYDDFPLPLRDINADLTIRTDLKNPQSIVRINRFDARTPQSSIRTTGTLNNLFADVRANLNTNLMLNLPEFAPFIPDSMDITATGTLSGNVKSVFTMSQIAEMQVEKMNVSGLLTLSDFTAVYDSLSVKSDLTTLEFSLPNPNPTSATAGFVAANVRTNSLEASKINSFDVSLLGAEIGLETSDVRDTTRMPNIVCVFKIADLAANMDSINFSVFAPTGRILLSPARSNPKNPAIDFSYRSGRIEAEIASNTAIIEQLELVADVMNDPEKENIITQWMPGGFIGLEQGKIMLAGVENPIEIPVLRMNFQPEAFAIERGAMIFENSDFSLSGRLNNISSWFRGDSILRGNFNFTSKMTDISQLMDMTNAIGYEEDEKDELAGSSSTFLVPKGVELTLNTYIDRAIYGKDVTADNIRGQVHVRDGTLILDQLTFTTPATDMELSVVYRTPRQNHLFVGINLRMLHIEIAELLHMIPEVDSLMPMLRSFGGRAEFRFSGDMYTDSLYNVKMSTIRGASSIRGTDLVLMDGETFSEIAQMLRFTKRAENKVDSLSAEFTIFRNDVDVYPFLIVMDRYKAVVGGRHDLDMSFIYNITVVESPIPFRLAVDVTGNLERHRVSLARTLYPEFYRPAYRREVESQELELRRLIRSFLLREDEG